MIPQRMTVLNGSLHGSNVASPNSIVLKLEVPEILPWRRKWQPTPVLLPGKSHGLGSLVGYSPWGRKELDTTEQLHFHFSL